MKSIIQILSALLATLGGLLISSDFIGVSRLQSVETSLRSYLKNLALSRYRESPRTDGLTFLVLGHLAAVVTIILVIVLTFVHKQLYPLPLFSIALCYGLVGMLGVMVYMTFPTPPSFVILPFLGVVFILVIIVEVLHTTIAITVVHPILVAHTLAERYGIRAARGSGLLSWYFGLTKYGDWCSGIVSTPMRAGIHNK